MDLSSTSQGLSVLDAKARLLAWATAEDAKPKGRLNGPLVAVAAVGAGVLMGGLVFRRRGVVGRLAWLALVARGVPLAAKFFAKKAALAAVKA